MFLQVPKDRQSEQSKEKDSEEQKQKELVSIFLKPSQTPLNSFEQVEKHQIYCTGNFFLFF